MNIIKIFLKKSSDFLFAAQFFIAPTVPFFHLAFIGVGDTIQIVLPAIAILFDLQRYYKNEGSLKNLLNTVFKVVLTSLVTHMIKKITRGTCYDMRPNGQRGSFPSGHTSAAFGGALLIHQIFGSRYGLCAYAFASCTAFTRVYGRYHHVRDVAAGALTALSMTMLGDLFIPREYPRPVVFNNMLPQGRRPLAEGLILRRA